MLAPNPTITNEYPSPIMTDDDVSGVVSPDLKRSAAPAHYTRNSRRHPDDQDQDDPELDEVEGADPHQGHDPREAKRMRTSKTEGVRRGKWTAEEQAYAARLIHDFEAGLLPLENGATLRAFLSKKLNCDPMRISKKFAGAKCLGKQIFLKKPSSTPVVTLADYGKYDEELNSLEEAFHRSVTAAAAARQRRQRSSAPKDPTAAAAAAARRSANARLRKAKAAVGSDGETDGSESEGGATTPNLQGGFASLAGPLSRGHASSCSLSALNLDIGSDLGDSTSATSEDDSGDESSSSVELGQVSSASTSDLTVEDMREAMAALGGEGFMAPSVTEVHSLFSPNLRNLGSSGSLDLGASLGDFGLNFGDIEALFRED